MQKLGTMPTESDSAKPGRLDSGMAARERNARELSPYLAILLYQGTRMVLGEGAHALYLPECGAKLQSAHYHPAQGLTVGIMRLARVLTYGVLGKREECASTAEMQCPRIISNNLRIPEMFVYIGYYCKILRV